MSHPECLDDERLTGRYFKCEVVQTAYFLKSLTIELEAHMKKFKCLKYHIADAIV